MSNPIYFEDYRKLGSNKQHTNDEGLYQDE